MLEDSISDGNRVVTMEEYRDVSHEGVLAGVPDGARCYVSIDVDALDLPLVPGCVSAEPEGMSYRDLRDTLAAIAEHTDVVGFDLVEVNPQLDIPTGITSYVAAQTIVEFLGRICAQPRWIDGADARAARRGRSREEGR
jgi:agmatinase